MSTQYDTVIGLEVHIQLNTQSKFLSHSACSFGAEPNLHANLLDLGYPGTLPVINKKALEKAIIFGLAVNAEICQNTQFARKNYFYPDLPKGYQTTQSDKPIVAHGKLKITLPESEKDILIVRAHLEEDAGKSIHDLIPGQTALDLNRAGSPLLEIVTAPDFCNAQEVIAYLKKLHRLVRYLDICDGNMQEGSFRVDVNISLKPKGSSILGTRCEIKNINSFRFIEKAIAYEVQRQSTLLDQGQTIRQQTRLFQESTGETIAMRDKENSHDYRYFPCPDLRTVTIESSWIENLRNQMPLPIEQVEKSLYDDHISEKEIAFLLDNLETLKYYTAIKQNHSTLEPKKIVSLLLSEFLGLLKKNNIAFNHNLIPAEKFATIVLRSQDGTLSSRTTKQLLALALEHTDAIDDLIQKHALQQVSDSNYLNQAIDTVIANYPEQFQEYCSGKEKILAFLVGQVMKSTQGSASPQEIQKIFQQKII